MPQKIQLFAAAGMPALQSEINQWLAGHADIDIIATNITSLAKVNVLSSDASTEGEYAFYILYHTDEAESTETMLSELQAPLPNELTDPRIIESEIN